MAAPFKILNDASQFVAPVFLNLLLSAIAAGAPVLHSYMLAVAMFVGLILGTICECQYWQRTMRAGFQLRAVLIAEVYRCVSALNFFLTFFSVKKFLTPPRQPPDRTRRELHASWSCGGHAHRGTVRRTDS